MVWAILNNTVMTGVDEFIDHQSERVVAILGGGVAEEALLRSMEVRFRKSRVTAEIFKDRGALGGFRSKIEVGYLLCAYEKPVRLALMGISEIRNFFAHNLEIKEFTGPNSKLDESFAKLSLHTIYSTLACTRFG